MGGKVSRVDQEGIRGWLHVPDVAADPLAGLALTHGAGGDCDGRLLAALAESAAEKGLLVVRYDLAFRIRGGTPNPSTAGRDRDGIRMAAQFLRREGCRRLRLGGHSYGGRQTSMLAATEGDVADELLLMSYPLHPPGRPDQLRTAHFPEIRLPVVFVHGVRDPFGTPEELKSAIAQIPGKVRLMEAPGAGHELARKGKEKDLAGKILEFLEQD